MLILNFELYLVPRNQLLWYFPYFLKSTTNWIIKDEIVKNPEAGAEKLKELTGSVESFTEEQVGNFSKTLLESIDSMPKPISAETSTLLMDSMANMFRKVFRLFILIHFDHFTKAEIHILWKLDKVQMIYRHLLAVKWSKLSIKLALQYNWLTKYQSSNSTRLQVFKWLLPGYKNLKQAQLVQS